jgi:hypothetical protein
MSEREILRQPAEAAICLPFLPHLCSAHASRCLSHEPEKQLMASPQIAGLWEGQSVKV